jgi:holo-[acyl-carrier protein] synthase
MIIDLASDLCNIERIQNRSTALASASKQRVFTEIERAKAARRRSPRPVPMPSALRPRRLFQQGGRHRFQGGVFMKDIGVVNARIRRANAGPDRRRARKA